jgi:hypothetical protein
MTVRRRRGGGDAQVPGERDQLVLEDCGVQNSAGASGGCWLFPQRS